MVPSTKDSVTVDEIACLFEGHDIAWWVAGGLAIDAFLGWQTREHADLDIEIYRADAELLHEIFAGWELATVTEDSLDPWPPRVPLSDAVYAVCARRASTSAWTVEVVLADGDDAFWRFRRETGIVVPRDEVSRVIDAIPYGMPEVQLLYKALRHRRKDDLDMVRCLHRLERRQLEWLATAIERLEPSHPWIDLIAAALTRHTTGV
ncbi:MAG: hypothetical protein R2823_10350 [Acidimicrobiia bacterium]